MLFKVVPKARRGVVATKSGHAYAPKTHAVHAAAKVHPAKAAAAAKVHPAKAGHAAHAAAAAKTAVSAHTGKLFQRTGTGSATDLLKSKAKVTTNYSAHQLSSNSGPANHVNIHASKPYPAAQTATRPAAAGADKHQHRGKGPGGGEFV